NTSSAPPRAAPHAAPPDTPLRCPARKCAGRGRRRSRLVRGIPARADREWARRAVASLRGLHRASAERSSSWAMGWARGHSSLHAHLRINGEALSNVPWERGLVTAPVARFAARSGNQER